MTAQDMVYELDDLQAKTRASRQRLMAFRAACDHIWSDVRYVPDIKEGFHVEAERLGSDSRGGYNVPRVEIAKWTRACVKCLLEQTTTNLIARKVDGKIPGTTVTIQEPNFEDK